MFINQSIKEHIYKQSPSKNNMQELSEYGKLKQQEVDLTNSKIWKDVVAEIERIQKGEDIREDLKQIKKRVEVLEKKENP